MKNTINFTLILFITLLLASCFGSSNDDQINQAKKELWVIESSGTIDTDSWWNIELDSENNILTDSWSEVVIEEEKIIITALTEEQFIELDDISDENLSDWELEITWKALVDLDKIIITFENNESDFPKDIYTLKQFTSGDKMFTYRAFSKYETFDYWKNVYTIDAYSDNKISTTQLTINFEKDQEEKDVSEKVNDVSEQISLNSLPVWSTFWNPISLGNGNISYSDLKWLEISNYSFPSLSCETLTNDLSEKIGTWFFWNTCRPIAENKWFSYYIVRLDWDRYVYEKHYYLSERWIYWIQELEFWKWVNKDNLREKNQELKEKNAEFTIIEVTDDLFKQITE